MITYKNIEPQYVPKFDLGLFTQTMDKIDKGRREAIKAKSDFEIAINNLPLNEEGDAEYKQSLIDKFNTAYEQGSVMDNPYYALDEIEAVKGEILGGAELKDRLTDQEEYNKWKEGIKNNNKLTDLEKEYIIDSNKYHFNPINETIQTHDINSGQRELITTQNYKSYSKWNPNLNYVEHINPDDIVHTAVKSIQGYVGYNDIETWEGKSKGQIRNAVDALLKSNPIYEQSIRQQYEASKWGFDNTKLTNDEMILFTYPDGTKISYEEYKNRLFDGLCGVMSYEHRAPIKTGGSGKDGNDVTIPIEELISAVNEYANQGNPVQTDFSSIYNFNINGGRIGEVATEDTSMR